jgi:hypothetical protein
MAGIGGSHVRAATAFTRSERFLRYSTDAQSLWLHLQSLAVDMKCEFLPEEYTPGAIARSWGHSLDQTKAALDELTGKTGLRRPIVNVISVQFGDEEPVELIRARGAREKQPVGWKDESDLARVWNEANPEDLIDVDAFSRARVNRRAEEGGSQDKDSKRVPQTPRKCTANATQTRSKRAANGAEKVGKVLATASRLPDRREEKRRKENKGIRSANATGARPELPKGSGDAGNDNGTDPRLVETFDGFVTGWGNPPDLDHDPRKRAMMYLGADPPRLLAHVMEISGDAIRFKKPWNELTDRLAKAKPPDDKFHDKAKKLIRKVTETA